MNKLKLLDELIMEVMREKNLVEKETKKGGVKGGEKQTPTIKSLDLNLAEILSIISLGTETGKDQRSSVAAAQNLVTSAGFQKDFSNSRSLAESFRFFDIQNQKFATAQCSSLGGLMSKYALAGALISIFEQFNASAGGFVNENFLSVIMGGSAIVAGKGGIEDIRVESDNHGLVGISLKTKKGTDVQGSMTQLLETLGISYYIRPEMVPGKGEKKGKEIKVLKVPARPGKFSKQVRVQQLGHTEHTEAEGIEYWTTSPIVDKLFYMFFSKGEKKGETARSLKITVVEITKEDVVGTAGSVEFNGVPHYNLAETNNIIGGNLKQLEASVRDKHTVSFGTDYSIEGFNETLKQNAGEVFESLMALDAWFGGLKEKLMTYVSDLESKSFTDMQTHLSNGAKFAFEAFDINSCKESS